MLSEGNVAPKFSLANQAGSTITLASLKGRNVLVYFYPKADTPGCTTQACLLNELSGQIGDTAVVGISPDKVLALAKFADKYSLGFDLLSDTDHAIAEAYGVWKEKKNYGKVYMGIERSAFLIGPTGKLRKVWYKISAKDTPVKLLEALAE